MQAKIKKAGVVLLSLLLVFIFLSKTIYAYNLAQVTAVMPENGTLKKTLNVSGVTRYANTEKIYSPISAKMGEIFIEEGSKVKAGDKLFTLLFDEDDLNRQLKQIAIDRNKLLIEIESDQLRLTQINKKITNKESEPYHADTVSTYQMDILEQKLQNAIKTVEEHNILYEAGAIAKSELDTTLDEVKQLELSLANEKQLYEEKVKAIEEDTAKALRDSNSSIEEYHNEKTTAGQSIKLKQAELSALAVKEEAIRYQLNRFSSNEIIYAANDGMVTAFSKFSGESVLESDLLVEIGIGYDFEIECTIPLKNNFIFAGDECGLKNVSNSINGVVQKVSPDEDAKKVTIKVTSEAITAGETFDISFKKISDTSYTLVPSGAIHKDTDGFFIYAVTQRDGLLGTEFYAKRINVIPGDSDSKNTAIIEGFTFFEPVISSSNKTFTENQSIKLLNSGDFFVQ